MASNNRGTTFYSAMLGTALQIGIVGEYFRHIEAIAATHLALWVPLLVVLGVGVALWLLLLLVAGVASLSGR